MRDMVLTPLPPRLPHCPFVLLSVHTPGSLAARAGPSAWNETTHSLRRSETRNPAEPGLQDHLLQEGLLESLEESSSPLDLHKMLLIADARPFSLPSFVIIQARISYILYVVTTNRLKQRKVVYWLIRWKSPVVD